MIIIGIEGCKNCHVYKDLHPEYMYVEIKRGVKFSSPDILIIKKRLRRLGFDFHFPVLLNNQMTELISSKVLMKEIKSK